MSVGPLRRLSGALGLVALSPVALRLAEGAMDPVDAAVRAIATLVVVLLVGRVLGTWIGRVAASYDRPDDAVRRGPVGGGSASASRPSDD